MAVLRSRGIDKAREALSRGRTRRTRNFTPRTGACVRFAPTGKFPDMAPRQERKLAGGGGRLFAIGAPFVVIGLVIALLLNGNTLGIGVAIAVLGAIPVAVGIALLLSAAV